MFVCSAICSFFCSISHHCGSVYAIWNPTFTSHSFLIFTTSHWTWKITNLQNEASDDVFLISQPIFPLLNEWIKTLHAAGNERRYKNANTCPAIILGHFTALPKQWFSPLEPWVWWPRQQVGSCSRITKLTCRNSEEIECLKICTHFFCSEKMLP